MRIRSILPVIAAASAANSAVNAPTATNARARRVRERPEARATPAPAPGREGDQPARVEDEIRDLVISGQAPNADISGDILEPLARVGLPVAA